jgi:hypothetical protein
MKFRVLSGGVDPTLLRRDDKSMYPLLKVRDFQKLQRATDPATGKRFLWSRGEEYHETHGLLELGGGLPDCLYRVNSDGMHGAENTHTPDVLAMGCSITSGMGLPYNFTWPDICRTVFGKTVNNVARAGSSISHQVYRAFANVHQYGVPKSIWFLAPDLFRGQIAVGPDSWFQRTLLFDHDAKSFTTTGYDPYIHSSLCGTKTVVPSDLIIDNNLKALEMLMMFAESHNIDLKIFSWHGQTWECFRAFNYPHLCEVPSFMSPSSPNMNDVHSSMLAFWEYPTEIAHMGAASCCDLEPFGHWQTKAWTVALDHTSQWKTPHPGLHSQIHFAEIFTGVRVDTTTTSLLRPWFEGTDLEPERK